MTFNHLLALFAWFNVFILIWVMMYGPQAESRWQTIAGLIFFFLIALISSMQGGSYGRR